MELLKSGLSFKKTIKDSLESLSENIGNHYKKDSKSGSVKWADENGNKEKHWREALEREKLRLIIHSQSLTIKGSNNHPKNVHPRDNFNTIRKPRLPTPPSSQKRRQLQHYTSSLGTISNSGDWHVSLSQCESDDSGRGDSEWSDISEFSTRSCLKQNFVEDKTTIVQLNSKFKVSNKNSDNKLKVLRMAEDNIKQKISQNHDEIYSLLEYLSKSMQPNQLQRISSYVADVEKITFLLHSLARRMAAAEMKIKLTNFNFLPQDEKEEWRRKHIKLAQQLKEAKDIKDILNQKYHAISNFLEKYKSVETRIQFGNLMEDKIKLMITFKEVEDKLKMEDRKDSFIMQSIAI